VESCSHFFAEMERTRPADPGPGRGPENLVLVRSVTSTNRLARAIVAEYEQEAQHLHPLLLLAREQTGGRGRHGRSWSSPAGKGVYATRVLTVDDAELLQSLPLLVGVALCRGLAPYLAAPCRLKWPNDLVVETPAGRRKIGGILIEALVHPGEPASAIIGFGVNHGHDESELPEAGTSLRLLAGSLPLPPLASLGELTWDLVAALERELEHLGDVPYAVASYREHTVHRPGDALSCRVGDKVVEGRFLGFDERGRLLLESGGEELSLAAGEVVE
jgi:BirA family transcriptional regulator, biotin operon repressor / biotin---[acetyl-CoA-carboxylase] ligase